MPRSMLRLVVFNLAVALATATVLGWHIKRKDDTRLGTRLKALEGHVDTTVDQLIYNNAVKVLCISAKELADDLAKELGENRSRTGDEGEELVVRLNFVCQGIAS